MGIKHIIDCWDPIDLLYHAPDDEYCVEIMAIERLCKQTTNVNSLAAGIYSVFCRAFVGEFRKTE